MSRKRRHPGPDGSTDGYDLVRRIARDRLGSLWEARDAGTGMLLAVRLFDERFRKDPATRRKLRERLEEPPRIAHPNIAVVVGANAGREGGNECVVMEELRGETLEQRRSRGPLPHDEAVAIATAVAKGLKAAHSQNVTHGNLTAEHVFLTEDGTTKIFDLGLVGFERDGATGAGSPDEDLRALAQLSADLLPSPEIDHEESAEPPAEVAEVLERARVGDVGDRSTTGEPPPPSPGEAVTSPPPARPHWGVDPKRRSRRARRGERDEAEQTASEGADQPELEEAELLALERADYRAREEAALAAWEEAQRKAVERSERTATERSERKAREKAERGAAQKVEAQAAKKAEPEVSRKADRKTGPPVVLRTVVETAAIVIVAGSLLAAGARFVIEARRDEAPATAPTSETSSGPASVTVPNVVGMEGAGHGQGLALLHKLARVSATASSGPSRP